MITITRPALVRIRPLFRTAFAVAVVTNLATLALTGCQSTAIGQPRPDGPSATATSPLSASTAAGTGGSTTPTPSADASGSGPLPDVCTLLSPAEVKALTDGKPILSVDPDGAGPAATVRFCQWQLSGARLAVQLSRTTEDTFLRDHQDGEPVTGLGDAAYFVSNHLLIRTGTIQIDVYASTAEGVTNDKQVAKRAAAKVGARLHPAAPTG
jgi:Protein of unknown function (DUF3558)